MAKNKNGKNPNYIGRGGIDSLDPKDFEPIDIKVDEDDVSDTTDEEIEQIATRDSIAKIPSSLLINTAGLNPVSVTYRMLIDTFKQEVLRLCKAAISGVEQVGISYNKENGEITLYCTFVPHCNHFTDKSTENTMLAGKPTTYYSPELKNFVKKFGMIPKYDCVKNNEGKIIGEFAKFGKVNNLNIQALTISLKDGNGNTTSQKGIRLSWTTFFRIIFDANGAGYNKKYGVRSGRINVNAYPVFTKTGGYEFGRLLYFEVIKSIDNTGMSDLKPKLGFKYENC